MCDSAELKGGCSKLGEDAGPRWEKHTGPQIIGLAAQTAEKPLETEDHT